MAGLWWSWLCFFLSIFFLRSSTHPRGRDEKVHTLAAAAAEGGIEFRHAGKLRSAGYVCSCVPVSVSACLFVCGFEWNVDKKRERVSLSV